MIHAARARRGIMKLRAQLVASPASRQHLPRHASFFIFLRDARRREYYISSIIGHAIGAHDIGASARPLEAQPSFTLTPMLAARFQHTTAADISAFRPPGFQQARHFHYAAPPFHDFTPTAPMARRSSRLSCITTSQNARCDVSCRFSMAMLTAR